MSCENLAVDRVPVIVITAHDTSENSERAMADGAAAWLRKPVDSRALLDAIATGIEHRNTAGPVSPPVKPKPPRHMTTHSRSFIVAAMLALLPACSSTHIQSARHPVVPAAAQFKNIMVVGMDNRSEVRIGFENDVARFLGGHGVAASPSYAQFTLEEIKGDKDQVRQRFLAANAESVLFVRVTDKDDFVDRPPVAPGSLDLGALDESRYNAFTTPGGEINSAFRLGARLYRVSDGAVVWSGVVDTVVKEDADSIVVLRTVAKTLVDRLSKDKVIP